MDTTTLMNKAMNMMKGGKRNSRKTRKDRKSRKNMRGGYNNNMYVNQNNGMNMYGSQNNGMNSMNSYMNAGKNMYGGQNNGMNSMNSYMNAGKNMYGGQNNMALNTHKNIPMNNVSGGALRGVGTRAEVMHGTAHHTPGGLTKKDLKYNKRGRIVSRRASEAGRKALRRLTRAGYKARKGKFTLFKRKH